MRFSAIAALGVLAAGCTTTAEPTPIEEGAGVCNAQPAQVLIGQKTSVALGRRALELTGATNLRWGPPGAIFTMDFRRDRVNVHYDQQMMVTEVRCG